MRNAIRWFHQKLGCTLIAAIIGLTAVTGLTVNATPAWASTSLSHPVPFSTMQFGYQLGKVVNVTFTRITDKYTKYELSGKTAPVLKATFGSRKASVTYSFTNAKVIDIKSVLPQEMVTWQVTTVSVSQNGHATFRGDFLQSTSHQPYP